jgi:AraC-like DNA-binding protein
MENWFRYIPVRSCDVQWGLYVTGAGYTSIPPDTTYPPRKHPKLYALSWQKGRTLPEYQAIYITRGEGEFESPPTGRCTVGPGSMIVLFPGVWHRYRPTRSVGWDEHWVSFNGDIADRLVAEGFFTPPHAVRATGVRPAILEPYRRLAEHLQNETPGFARMIAANTMEILAAASVTSQESDTDADREARKATTVDDRMVADALRLIWEQGHEVLSVDDIARQLPVTRRSLERRFRSSLNRTIHEEIARCRLERAMRLLEKTKLSIKEIAVAAGFPTAGAMSRAVQEAAGATPAEIRRQSKPSP